MIKFVVIIALFYNGESVATSTFEGEYKTEQECLTLASIAAEALTERNYVNATYTCVLQ